MKKGRFGEFGGQYVPETLMNALIELENEYEKAIKDDSFLSELKGYLINYSNRETQLYYAKRLSEKYGKGKIYLKREDLNHTGSHKLNNVLGQMLLAKRMNKKRIIAETGAGQHGVATATCAAMFGLECEIYMGREDVERQKLNVFKMKMLGAKVNPVDSGTKTLKDATNEALKDWVLNVENTYYVIGSVVWPHPYPKMVRDFQKIIGIETKKQIIKMEGKLPDVIIACVGGGSNAIGMFYEFINNKEVKLIGVEAAGKGIDTKDHAATLTLGGKGVFHGMKSYFLQDEDGQIYPPYSISAGLDYPGIGPEHSYLKDSKRAKYVAITDKQAVDAYKELSKLEGIIPALESSHALAYAIEYQKKSNIKDEVIVVNLSGRGDKDVYTIADLIGEEI